MTIQLSTERNIMALALAFTIGTACGLATSGTGIPISLRYLSAGISSIAAIAMTTWTRFTVSQCKLLLTYLAAGIFCATTCQLSSTGVQAMRTSTAAADFGSMIMSLPFRSDDAAALVNALVTGDKSWLSPEIVGTFRTSGASHILALSGLHLGIIYIILGYATSILGRSPVAKTTRSIIIVSLSGAYTIVTGAAPSLVRAFLFILINETAHLLHRKSNPVHTFCAALMIQMAVNPSVLESAGFQLSYLAMAGIITLFPKMKAWYPEPGKEATRSFIARFPKKVWDAAALTLACQIFTGPLAWLRFGTFPMHFLLTNILAMPLTTVLMTLAVPSVLLAAAGLCPTFLISATGRVAEALIYVMQVVAGM